MYRLSILERRKKNSYAFFPKEKYFSDDEPITISFLKKTSFIALYLFADPRHLLQMPPFHVDTHTHTYTHTFLGRNDDGLVCDSSRSAKIEGKIALSWTFCIDMWNWGGGEKHQRKTNDPYRVPRYQIFFRAFGTEAIPCQTRAAFEIFVEIWKRFRDSLILHISPHTHTYIHTLFCKCCNNR